MLSERRGGSGGVGGGDDVSLCRSGSAPPTVEGALSSVGGLFGGGVGAPESNWFPSEEQLRADPAYASYYYSHQKLNPRLPPPVVSKEDWRRMQQLQAGGGSGLGGIGDRRRVGRQAEDDGGRSLFSMQPGFGLQNGGGVDPRIGREWMERGEDGMIGLVPPGRRKSFAEMFQEDIGNTPPINGHSSRPASRNTLNDVVELDYNGTRRALHHEIVPGDGLQAGGNNQSVAGLQNIGGSSSHNFATVLGSSQSRSTTPDPQFVQRAPTSCLPPVGVMCDSINMNPNNCLRAFNSVTPSLAESDDILAALSDMNLLSAGAADADITAQSKLQQEIKDKQNFLFDCQYGQNHNNQVNQHPLLNNPEPSHLGMLSIPQPAKSLHSDSANRFGGFMDLRNSTSRPDAQVKLQMPTVPSASAYMKGPYAPSGASFGGSSPYQNGDRVDAALTNYVLGGYNPALPSMMEDHFGALPSFENASAASTITSLGTDSRVFGGGVLSGSNINGPNNLSNLTRIGNHKAASALQMPLADPLFIQYLKSAGYAAQVASNYSNPSVERVDNPYMNLLEVQKACLGALQSQEQYGMPFLGKPAVLNHAYYEDPLFGLGATHPGHSRLVTPGLPGSPVGHGSLLRHGERRFPSGLRNSPGGTMGWQTDFNGGMEESFPCSLLEEFKSNKTRCFELFEIAGHVVEFSADQYGSRFIQQKLETATTEEKDMVYEEIMPQALSLMTDVFGNYVVQKFFEHGSAAQIRELVNKLDGHVLALSLQMYGCRVIQKAIEVVDLDQKTKMVAELDGNVIRCVRDQNGNHVIQKCIECIPQDAIQFIISTFYDQIVTLSTHPYGCRVVQRILEHCDNPDTQQIVMDEIMRCICMLAQDQYGNYVVQHVLEHGKPHERSAIIEQLAGQIVQMSQQKFASNVVEKCLTFCGLEERQHLVNEMLGSTDENEPLQAMMKDQFGNYVVQKVLETCDDQQRELILTRIKIHLNALKKYTYGKHIVARVEKLVAAGERRIGLQNLYPTRTE